MRLDLYLKRTGLVKRRSWAEELCETGAVIVNGRKGKKGKDVAPGDILDIKLRRRALKVKVIQLPEKNISKKKAAETFEVMEERKINEDLI